MNEVAMAWQPRALGEALQRSLHNGDRPGAVTVTGLVSEPGER